MCGNEFAELIKIGGATDIQTVSVNIRNRFRIGKHNIEDAAMAGGKWIALQIRDGRTSAPRVVRSRIATVPVGSSVPESAENEEGLDVFVIPDGDVDKRRL